MNQQAFFPMRRGASAGPIDAGLILLPQAGAVIEASKAAMGPRPPSIEALRKLPKTQGAYWWAEVCKEQAVASFLQSAKDLGAKLGYLYELEAKIQILQAKKDLIQAWGAAFASGKQQAGLAEARAALDAGCAGLGKVIIDNWNALGMYAKIGLAGNEVGPGAPYAGALDGWTKKGGIVSVTAAPNPNVPTVRTAQVVILPSDLYAQTVSGAVAVPDFIAFWGAGNATTAAVLTALFKPGGTLNQGLLFGGSATRPLYPEVAKYVKEKILSQLLANGAFYKFGSTLAFKEAQASLKADAQLIELYGKEIGQVKSEADALLSMGPTLLAQIKDPLSQAVAKEQGEIEVALAKQAGLEAAAQLLIDAAAKQGQTAEETAKLVKALSAKNSAAYDAGALAGAAFAAGSRAAGSKRNNAGRELTDESGRLLGQIDAWLKDNPGKVPPDLSERKSRQQSQASKIAEIAAKIIEIGKNLQNSLKFLGAGFNTDNADDQIDKNTEDAGGGGQTVPETPPPASSPLPLLLLLGAVALTQLGGAK